MATWDLNGTKHHLLICNGGSCMRYGGEEVTQAIREEISLLEANEHIHTTRTRCNGRCQDACVVISYPEGNWYKNITPSSGKQIVRSLLGLEQPILNSISYTFQDGKLKNTLNTVTGEHKK